MVFTQEDEELIHSSADRENKPESVDEASAAYELIYHIDVSKEPSLSVIEENGQQKVAFYLPLNDSITSREEAMRLANALALKINRQIEATKGNGW